jgi:phosphoribosylanthranilate isomerase
MSVFIKICGVRTLEDALFSAEAGADGIGFNFWSGSKRFIPVEEAAPIANALPPSVKKIGVLVDPTVEEVERALAVVDLVQLHGSEPAPFCARFAGRYVKAIRLTDESALVRMGVYDCELLLVDADTPGFGGSGLRANVALARRAAERRKILLAGGLTPANVAEAITMVRPFGVDVASGVERAPGVKDHDKIAAFIAAARAQS